MNRSLSAFLCYARDDKIGLQILEGVLKELGVVYFKDENDLVERLEKGGEWWRTIRSEIQRRDLFIVWLTKTWVRGSGVPHEELAVACESDRQVVVFEGAEVTEELLNELDETHRKRFRAWHRVPLWHTGGDTPAIIEQRLKSAISAFSDSIRLRVRNRIAAETEHLPLEDYIDRPQARKIIGNSVSRLASAASRHSAQICILAGGMGWGKSTFAIATLDELRREMPGMVAFSARHDVYQNPGENIDIDWISLLEPLAVSRSDSGPEWLDLRIAVQARLLLHDGQLHRALSESELSEPFGYEVSVEVLEELAAVVKFVPGIPPSDVAIERAKRFVLRRALESATRDNLVVIFLDEAHRLKAGSLVELLEGLGNLRVMILLGWTTDKKSEEEKLEQFRNRLVRGNQSTQVVNLSDYENRLAEDAISNVFGKSYPEATSAELDALVHLTGGWPEIVHSVQKVLTDTSPAEILSITHDVSGPVAAATRSALWNICKLALDRLEPEAARLVDRLTVLSFDFGLQEIEPITQVAPKFSVDLFPTLERLAGVTGILRRFVTEAGDLRYSFSSPGIRSVLAERLDPLLRSKLIAADLDFRAQLIPEGSRGRADALLDWANHFERQSGRFGLTHARVGHCELLIDVANRSYDLRDLARAKRLAILAETALEYLPWDGDEKLAASIAVHARAICLQVQIGIASRRANAGDISLYVERLKVAKARAQDLFNSNLSELTAVHLRLEAANAWRWIAEALSYKPEGDETQSEAQRRQAFNEAQKIYVSISEEDHSDSVRADAAYKVSQLFGVRAFHEGADGADIGDVDAMLGAQEQWLRYLLDGSFGKLSPALSLKVKRAYALSVRQLRLREAIHLKKGDHAWTDRVFVALDMMDEVTRTDSSRRNLGELGQILHLAWSGAWEEQLYSTESGSHAASDRSRWETLVQRFDSLEFMLGRHSVGTDDRWVSQQETLLRADRQRATHRLASNERSVNLEILKSLHDQEAESLVMSLRDDITNAKESIETFLSIRNLLAISGITSLTDSRIFVRGTESWVRIYRTAAEIGEAIASKAADDPFFMDCTAESLHTLQQAITGVADTDMPKELAPGRVTDVRRRLLVVSDATLLQCHVKAVRSGGIAAYDRFIEAYDILMSKTLVPISRNGSDIYRAIVSCAASVLEYLYEHSCSRDDRRVNRLASRLCNIPAHLPMRYRDRMMASNIITRRTGVAISEGYFKDLEAADAKQRRALDNLVAAQMIWDQQDRGHVDMRSRGWGNRAAQWQQVTFAMANCWAAVAVLKNEPSSSKYRRRALALWAQLIWKRNYECNRWCISGGGAVNEPIPPLPDVALRAFSEMLPAENIFTALLRLLSLQTEAAIASSNSADLLPSGVVLPLFYSKDTAAGIVVTTSGDGAGALRYFMIPRKLIADRPYRGWKEHTAGVSRLGVNNVCLCSVWNESVIDDEFGCMQVASTRTDLYVLNVLNILFPNPIHGYETNANLRQNIFLGGSNSELVLRLPRMTYELFIAGDGVLKDELSQFLGLRRLTVFSSDVPSTHRQLEPGISTEIDNFIGQFWSELRVVQREAGKIVCVCRGLPNFRRQRTFESLCSKLLPNVFANTQVLISYSDEFR